MARLGNVFNNKEDIRKEEQHPRRTIKWIHYTKLKENPGQYCPERDKEEIEALADLIEAAGEVIQNLSVSKLDTDEYRIIAGHKRCKACKLLVEERGLKQFSFLPCVVSNLSSVQEEFQVVASNGYHQKKAYELMHEILKTEKLLKEHPEEFPESLQKGRMIERLSRKMGIARSTIQEYKQISNNLTSEAMEKFKNGEIEKSAAVTLSKMPEESQKEVIGQGITQNVDIEKYRQENLEPNSVEVKVSFRLLDVGKYDKSTVTRDTNDGDMPSLQNKRAAYREIIKKQIDYDVLRQSPYDMNIIDNIVEVIVNIYASQKECINISGDMIPLNEVINRLKRINLTHIQYVMECIGKSIKSIRRPNNYLLTALYNAPVTTDLYYAMQVKHDLHNYSDG